MTALIADNLTRWRIASLNREICSLLKVQAIYGPNTVHSTLTTERIMALRDERARLQETLT